MMTSIPGDGAKRILDATEELVGDHNEVHDNFISDLDVR